MRQVKTPFTVDDSCNQCQDDPCSGVRSIGEILGELLGTIDFQPRQNSYDVSGPFRFTAASGRVLSVGR
jgi:hypothetical protein